MWSQKWDKLNLKKNVFGFGFTIGMLRPLADILKMLSVAPLQVLENM
jgi:hypothetical protein